MKIAHSLFVSSQSNVQSKGFIPSPTSRQAPRKVSAQQWGAYWGMNKMERLQKVLESLLVAYGGAWMAWFLSMLAGNVVSSFAGTALIFNWMYSPWLNAKKRNSKIWQSGNQKLSYALYAGRIISLKRIKRRSGKTIGAVSQEYLVMIVQDELQRELEIITQWQEPYRKLRLQMRCENMIASTTRDFSVLSMVTDSWIPACEVWVGDYPYLDRTAFKDFVSTIEPTKKETTSRSSTPNGSSSGRSDTETSNKSDRIGRNRNSTAASEIDSDKVFNSTKFSDSSSGKYDHYGDDTERNANLEEMEDFAALDFLDNENKEQFIRKINRDGSKMRDTENYDIQSNQRNSYKRSDGVRDNEDKSSRTKRNNELRLLPSDDISLQLIRSQNERRERSKRK